jgi:hypothetical protein
LCYHCSALWDSCQNLFKENIGEKNDFKVLLRIQLNCSSINKISLKVMQSA